MERANLKLRHPAIFESLQAEWNAWNATMLPPDPEANSAGFSATQLADHFDADD
jgi:hypothetical protein